jgi:glutamyl/glutaminyl-tRNA synthetase
VAEIARPWFERAGIGRPEELGDGWFADLMGLVKTRSRTLHDLLEQARPFFPGPVEYQPDAVEKFWKDAVAAEQALAVAEEYAAAEDRWGELEAMEARLRSLAEERGVAPGKVMQSMRVALTGQRVSPGIFETMVAMGPELVRERIAAARDWLARRAVTP